MPMEKLARLWPEWKIEKQIGRGTFGSVYQAVRQTGGLTSRAAIKVVSIPQSEYELETLRADGMDSQQIRTYLKRIVDDFANEIRVMKNFRGRPNIVSIDEAVVSEKTDGLGWDIFIRMELLTPFTAYISDKKLDETEVIRLGCDICTALEQCSRRNIIHRDIKPENIFVDSFGSFKLGDFGTARQMEGLTSGFSQKGTFNYMAPEVVNGTGYDARVDLYSLGLVLYRLMNGNRLPFVSKKQLLSPSERRNALDRRIRGDALPPPEEASPALAQVILHACAYRREDRFENARQMHQALLSCAAGEAPDLPQTREEEPTLLIPQDITLQSEQEPPENPGKKRKLTAWLAALVLLAGSCLGFYYLGSALSRSPDNREMQTVETTAAAETTVAAETTEPSQAAVPEQPLGKEILKIVIKELPDKLHYENETALDTTGMVLEVTYVDLTKETITEGFTCYPTRLQPGHQDITVEYGGKQKTFQVLMVRNASDIMRGFSFNDLDVSLGAAYDIHDSTTGINRDGNVIDWRMEFAFGLTDYQRDHLGYNMGLETSWGHRNDLNSSVYQERNAVFAEAKDGKTCSEYGRYVDDTEDPMDGRDFWEIYLPDDPSLAGEQSVTLFAGECRKTVYFTLVYKGGYETGTGWEITDIFWEDALPAAEGNQDIGILTLPNRQEYTLNEVVDVTGLTLQVTGSDGSAKPVRSGFFYWPKIVTETGVTQVQVVYQGVETSFPIHVAEESGMLSVETLPDKQVYQMGERLDTQGLSLRVRHADGTEEIITEGFTCNPQTIMGSGFQTVTVTYEGMITRFMVSSYDIGNHYDWEAYYQKVEDAMSDFTFENVKLEPYLNYHESSGAGLNQDGTPVTWMARVTFDLTQDQFWSLNRTNDIEAHCSWDYSRSFIQDIAGSFMSARMGVTAVSYEAIPARESESGNHQYAFDIQLPDDPRIAGNRWVKFCVGEHQMTVNFRLEYLGDYDTGLGWAITDIEYEA